MFGNYLTSALRALRRDRFHAVLNIGGLSVALAATLLIALYIQHELSYESFFTQPEKVFRVEVTYLPSGQQPIAVTVSPHPLVDALNADYSNQLVATQIRSKSSVITVGDTHLREDVGAAKDNLFDVLDFPVAYGDAAAVLKQPGYVILSESKSQQLFGTANAVGRNLRIDDNDFQVGAVLKDLPVNTQFTLSLLVSGDAKGFELPAWQKDNWNNGVGLTYFRLKTGGDVKAIAADMQAFSARHIPPDQGSSDRVEFRVRPLKDIHLKAGNGLFPSNRNEIALGALSGTALLLILIASFNYVNLATARAMLRRSEVGLRKILGGSTRQLVTQFMGETLGITVLAFVLAVVLAALFLPAFAKFVDRDLALASALTPGYVAFGIGLFLFISFAAGSYPALYLASSRPIALFQKQKASAGRRNLFRSLMVGVQFSLTVSLIVVAVVVFAQVHYLKNFDLGFRKDGVLVMNTFTNAGQDTRVMTLRDALARIPFFSRVSASFGTPDASYESNEALYTDPSQRIQTQKNAQVLYTDENFFKVYGIEPIAGRVYSPDIGTDEMPFPGTPEAGRRSAIVLSESAVSYYGFPSPERAVGQTIYGYNGSLDKPAEFEIIGVVPDIQMRLGRMATKPMSYHYFPAALSQVSVRLTGGDVEAAMHQLSQIWSQIFPGQPMDYTFIEDRVNAANADDTRQSQLFTFFTGLAIVIACLGLFGLASFVAARRTQEIAIRKVLGASTANVARLLLWDFAKPVLAANIIAWPIAWLLMRQWLDGFPYRIELSPAFFFGGSFLALAIALLTVAARTLKAARTRPAVALKYE